MDTGWTLHPQLAADSHRVGTLPLSELLLSKDGRYPWFILVPRRAGIREIYELDESDRRQLLDESVLLGEALMKVFAGDKLNVAALGNQVPQLHVHHIVRHRNDPAWPQPVWGHSPGVPYTPEGKVARIDALRSELPGGWLP